MLNKSIGFLFVALLFGACAGGSGGVPSWFYSSASDEKNLYGVGSNKDLQRAKDAALSDMLSTLMVGIQSKTNVSSSFSDGIESNSIKESINKEIARATLRNINYKVQTHDNTYFVRAHITKSDFISQLKEDNKKSLNKLQALNIQCDDIALNQYNALKMELAKISRTQGYLSVLGASGTSFLEYSDMFERNSPKPKLALIISEENKQGGKELKSALQKELVKFYRLDSKASQKAFVSFDLSYKEMSAEVKIADCNGNTTFIEEFKESSKSADIARLANRIGVLLYKKLNTLE